MHPRVPKHCTLSRTHGCLRRLGEQMYVPQLGIKWGLTDVKDPALNLGKSLQLDPQLRTCLLTRGSAGARPGAAWSALQEWTRPSWRNTNWPTLIKTGYLFLSFATDRSQYDLCEQRPAIPPLHQSSCCAEPLHLEREPV